MANGKEGIARVPRQPRPREEAQTASYPTQESPAKTFLHAGEGVVQTYRKSVTRTE